jgi:hypothetical protein
MNKILLFVAMLCVFGAVGCSGDKNSGPDLSKAEADLSSRLDKIAKASGGDWEKVPQADKEYAIKELGSEQSAKMFLAASGGKLGGRAPGGPPKR